MGLDLFVKGSKKCASMSYGSVHQFRIKMVLLTVGHYLATHPGLHQVEDEDLVFDELVSWLPVEFKNKLDDKPVTLEWVKRQLSDEDAAYPDYESMHGDPPIYGKDDSVRQARYGLYKLVNHSDCDGLHSAGDCVDILHFLDYIKPALHLIDDNADDYFAVWFNKVRDVFVEAVKKKADVLYG